MTRKPFSFDLGPISRTLGSPPDHIGFASLPIHEVMTALLGARNHDEFIAWLWHDTFKSLFTLEIRGGKPFWQHLFNDEFERFANIVGNDPQLVIRHHFKNKNRTTDLIDESLIISNEFEQQYLGEEAHFVQLTFRCQPVASTLVLRLAIAEAFLREISKVAAQAIADLGLSFTQVKYIFHPEPRPLTEKQIAALYDMKVQDSMLEITHWVPSDQFRPVWVQMDLTGAPPDRDTPQVIGLSELLTVYRDDLTIIAVLPLLIRDPDNAVREIEHRMHVTALEILTQLNIAMTHKKALMSNLLDVILDEQVEVRPVYEPHVSNEPRDPKNPKKALGKAIYKLIAHPYELMADNSLVARCLVCGSPIKGGKGRYFKGGKRMIEDIFSGHFADLEYLALDDDVCPMCLVYANSDNKKLLRGSLALLVPSTSLQSPVGDRLIEQPRFDQANRFCPHKPMVKSVVTLQELVLLTLLSRRILSGLVTFEIGGRTGKICDIILRKAAQGEKGQTQPVVVGKYLPYSEAYCLFDITAVNQFYKTAFLGQGQNGNTIYDVWQEIHLTAYPFEFTLSPSFTMLLELQRNADFQAHAQAHTLLKVNPTTIYLSPHLAFHVLVDNSVQEIVDKEYVDTVEYLEKLASMAGINRYEFIKALLAGEDQITAVYETTEPPSQRQNIDWDTLKMIKAKQISDQKEVMGQGSPEEMWATFKEQYEKLRTMCQAHPTLIHFFQKPKKRGGY